LSSVRIKTLSPSRVARGGFADGSGASEATKLGIEGLIPAIGAGGVLGAKFGPLGGIGGMFITGPPTWNLWTACIRSGEEAMMPPISRSFCRASLLII
jgi:hypothetical protein